MAKGKKPKGQTTTYKILHKKQNIEQQKLGVNSFPLAIVLSVRLRFMDSDYPFWYLQTLLMPNTMLVQAER
jgi:hypothetical protein